LVLANPRKLYPLLFECAAQSLLEFGRSRLHGDLGITAVLHTWGQKLNFHPHLHCIVTGGALSPDGKHWRSPKQRKFLFPVRAVAALFRGKFLAGLRQMLAAGELHLPDSGLIRRFSLHILPSGLVRIRHYGILGNNRRKRAIEAARAIFKCRGRDLVLQPHSVPDKPMCCPSCGKIGIRLVAFTDAAGVLHMIGAGPTPDDSS
jgi:hypothetical protein